MKLNFGTLVAAATFAMTMSAQAQTKWDLPAAYPATNFHSVNLSTFASDFAKATDGKRTIRADRPRSARFCSRPIRTNGRCSVLTAYPSWPRATPTP